MAQPFDMTGSKGLFAYFTRRTFWFEYGVSVAERLYDQDSRSVLECSAPGKVDKLLLSMDRPIPQPYQAMVDVVVALQAVLGTSKFNQQGRLEHMVGECAGVGEVLL